MSVLEGLKVYHRTLGVRGVLAISIHRLLGRPKEISVKPPTIDIPLSIRLRTTDPLVYAEVFKGRQYDLDIPFTPRTIVDAGANIGATSVFFANRYPDAKIIAIEPEASNFDMLKKNVRAYRNVVPIRAALWGRDGEISISAPDPASGGFGEWGFVTHEGGASRVRSISMRTLMASMGVTSIDLLKVDIEGAEKEVFEACDWMDGVKCLAIELHDRLKPGCSSAVDSVMSGFDRRQRGETTLYLRTAVVAA